MTSEFLHGFLRAGMFVALVSLVLVFVTQSDSAEFVVSVCSLGVGLTLIGWVLFMTWLGRR